MSASSSTSQDSFGTLSTFTLQGKEYHYSSLKALSEKTGKNLDHLPLSLRVLLENLLRNEDGSSVDQRHIEALLNWDSQAEPSVEIAYRPARVVLQDFTGVPCVVDLAAMREAFQQLGGDPARINPLQPVDLVIDHSVQVDAFGREDAFSQNVQKEYQRNQERYAFLRWGQQAFENFRVVPPGTGIVHQVNLEYLAHVVFEHQQNGKLWAYPDTLVGTDSHTTMINGLGILGWGVGGIEAEAAMLGQPISMLIPQVVGFEFTGKLQEGATATDLVLRVVEMLRELGVVGKFVEFFGAGLSNLTLADRATIANMAPEYGATMGFFPVDNESLEYLRFTGRDAAKRELVQEYLTRQGLFHTPDSATPEYTTTLKLDLAEVEPAIAGPKRPQDRIALHSEQGFFEKSLPKIAKERTIIQKQELELDGEKLELEDGSVVIAAITSCTNTSNPAVLMAAGLVAKKACELGLQRKPWVKTSLAPGSQVVTDYLQAAGLMEPLQKLGFHLVGYGCTTCIGNSGPLPEAISKAIDAGDLVATSVLSGNRNFEGRISPDVRANYLASPPLVVAYALAGDIKKDIFSEPIGEGTNGAVYLKDIWPSNQEVQAAITSVLQPEMFQKRYGAVFEGDQNWQNMPTPKGKLFDWDENSTYIRKPSFFDGLGPEPESPQDIQGARVLALLGDSITTDHISPAGAISSDGPGGLYLKEKGVEPLLFNSFGSRRGNHEVMVRGTFSNIRLRNQLVPGVEGGYTKHFPEGKELSIYDAALQYKSDGVPLIVIAGAEYGTGSSRDWAAKGTLLLGVRAVIAKSFERIHRSNLIGMGVLPLEFQAGESAEKLELQGNETYQLQGLAEASGPNFSVQITAQSVDGSTKSFQAQARIDTPDEFAYWKHGGILQYVLRSLKNA